MLQIIMRGLTAHPALAALVIMVDDLTREEVYDMLRAASLVQWVLHQTAPQGATLKAEVQRDDRTQEILLTLSKGWRQRDDISWRASTWGLRRMATGGMLLESLTDQGKTKAGLAASAMALRAQHVGQYGPHAAAQNAGFKKNDILISFDGRSDLLRESDLIAHALFSRQPNDRVNVTVLRDGKKLSLILPMQP